MIYVAPLRGHNSVASSPQFRDMDDFLDILRKKKKYDEEASIVTPLVEPINTQ